MGGKAEMKNRVIPDEPEKVLLCYYCGNKTLMKKIAGHHEKEAMEELFGYDSDGNPIKEVIHFENQWNLYKCPVCYEVTLERMNWCDEYPDHIGEDILHPKIKITSLSIPVNVKKRFEAALKVKNLDNEQCIMAIRRVMESICKNKGAQGRDLDSKIIDLSNKGILPPQLGNMGHLLRVLGNKAAHVDDVEFTDEVVEKAIDFISVILDYVYVIPNDISVLESEIEKIKNKAKRAK